VIRAVLDTNVLVSGFAFAGGVPDQVLRLWQAGRFQLVLSQHILTELRRTLDEPFFQSRISSDDVQRSLTLVVTEAEIVSLTAVVAGIATQPEDDPVLGTAVSASAPYLVTGDRQLQRLGTFQGVTILSPREFHDLLLAQQPAP
jgi:putative PIN family toxin of toxin-antitoxin system